MWREVFVGLGGTRVQHTTLRQTDARMQDVYRITVLNGNEKDRTAGNSNSLQHDTITELTYCTTPTAGTTRSQITNALVVVTHTIRNNRSLLIRLPSFILA
jgi:hypothetical protein